MNLSKKQIELIDAILYGSGLPLGIEEAGDLDLAGLLWTHAQFGLEGWSDGDVTDIQVAFRVAQSYTLLYFGPGGIEGGDFPTWDEEKLIWNTVTKLREYSITDRLEQADRALKFQDFEKARSFMADLWVDATMMGIHPGLYTRVEDFSDKIDDVSYYTRVADTWAKDDVHWQREAHLMIEDADTHGLTLPWIAEFNPSVYARWNDFEVTSDMLSTGKMAGSSELWERVRNCKALSK